MDYKELLRKYLEFLVAYEGTNFVSDCHEGYGFTTQEIEALKELDK